MLTLIFHADSATSFENTVYKSKPYQPKELSFLIGLIAYVNVFLEPTGNEKDDVYDTEPKGLQCPIGDGCALHHSMPCV